jgi:hypothetical protein
MNYITKLQNTVAIYEDCINDLRSYLALPKFNWPEDHVNVADVHLRLRAIEERLGALEAGEYDDPKAELENKPRGYSALDAKSRSIVTVLALSPEDAGTEIKRELNLNPSRAPYYDKWVAGGRKVRTDDGAVTELG